MNECPLEFNAHRLCALQQTTSVCKAQEVSMPGDVVDIGCGSMFSMALVRPNKPQSNVGGESGDGGSEDLECYSWGAGYNGALAHGHMSSTRLPRKVLCMMLCAVEQPKEHHQ